MKTELGAVNLNRELQAVLNPGRSGEAEVKKFDTTFRVGDKVMQTQNNYQREVFNGDVGFISKVETVDQIVSLLSTAKKPIILFGRGSRKDEYWHPRIRLAERLGACVFTDLKQGAMFPSDHPAHYAEPSNAIPPGKNSRRSSATPRSK